MSHVDTDDPWSATEKDLREEMRSLRKAGQRAAVATIVSVEGSAYRRPGAKMLISADKDSYGAVTAGCLEDAVLDIAHDVIDTHEPRTEVFDLIQDDTETWGLGLGCNGVIELLVEPLDASWDYPLTAVADGDPVTVATVTDSESSTPKGSRTVIMNDTQQNVNNRHKIPNELIDSFSDTIERVHSTNQTQITQLDGTQILIDGLTPTANLLIFGGQKDITPMAKLANQVGFTTHVHSGRGAVDRSSVPADSISTGHPTEVATHVGNAENTYAIVMSHNLLDDRLAVETLLSETEIPYLGVMGPRERFKELCDSLLKDNAQLTTADLDRIAAPVGLDLGGGEPVEIALSIVSEILAVSNDREGGQLCERTGPIHSRTGEDSNSE
ncbi:XdhC family protein [Haloquadratum walsbyi]|uniref:Xanthine and CO dehydrogenase maturation factor, XdhC/CoxF family n=1 Tax=Haloquadratum walsbyi J07HQW2 TaxID=1238425 RepID=U1N2B8_9EURY|nr:XdhC family protein [Haloquadratum walsbyi]ERG97019.1 MAG: Xanthine and CO dehydrogenase maturation factor, XdhC/CoxF family [Haloquadratum walsbyi J07HQW2]